jgi:hypothetical protein
LVSLRERVYQYQSEILELRDRLSREINLQGNPTGGRISPKNGFAGALDVRNMVIYSRKIFLTTTELLIESVNVYIETKRNVDPYISFLMHPYLVVWRESISTN